MNIKNVVIRGVTAFSWRISNERLARSLNRFSQVEADSAWQMLQALSGVEDPEFKAKLFNNALEEVHHAALFKKMAHQLSSLPLPVTTPARKAIFRPERGLVEFEAYHFVGEADVYSQFLSYANAASLQNVREMFVEIRGDEEEHQKLAYAELSKMKGSEKAARRLIAQVRLKRLWDAWQRTGKSVADSASSIILMALFIVIGPFFGALCKSKLDKITHGPTRIAEG